MSSIQVFPMMCGTCSNENGIKLMFMRCFCNVYEMNIVNFIVQVHAQEEGRQDRVHS